MSSVSSMGQIVGILYDVRDDNRYHQLGNDETFPTSDDTLYLFWSSVSLPPFGLAPISQRRATVDPSHEPLPQRPEKDKISKSVMKKYNKIPAEERCYVRMKLDLLITLTLNIVKPQPKVREVLLALTGDITTVFREDLPIGGAEISLFKESVSKLVQIANATLKARSVNEMASVINSPNLTYIAAQQLCSALNNQEPVLLWNAIIMYQMAHNRVDSPYLIVIYCHSSLRMYKKWLDAQYGLNITDHSISELYHLAHQTVKASSNFRDFEVNIVKHLSSHPLGYQENDSRTQD